MSSITGRLRIERAGTDTSLQDTGRPTSRSWGVPRSGVVDRFASAQLNRQVGNLTSAAVLETGGGLIVTASMPATVATTSQPEPHQLERGEKIEVEPADGERWGYLAVRGGFEVPTVIGSRSRDHLGQMGPLPIIDGSAIDVGSSELDEPSRLAASGGYLPPEDAGPIQFHVGPHATGIRGFADSIVAADWLVDHQRAREFVVLTGVELPSPDVVPAWGFPLIEGAVTLEADGSLRVSLCNDATCTGSPVVGVVDPADLGRLAQRVDGARCRFTTPR